MTALRLGQEVLDLEARNDVLRAIAEIKSISKDVDARFAALPDWAKAPGSPLGEDLQKILDAEALRKRIEPAVLRVEQRLSTGGPVWPVLTAEETGSINDMITALGAEQEILSRHAPTEWEKDVRRMVLLALGVGAVFAPLLWTEEAGDSVARAGLFPLRFPPWHLPGTRPPAPPPGVGPAAPGWALVPPARPAAPPPLVPTAPAFRPVPPTGAPVATPAGFTRPLGPHIPIYPRFQRSP